MLKIITGIFCGLFLGSLSVQAESFDVQKEIKNGSIIYHVDMEKDEKVLIQDVDLMLTINKIEDHSCPKGAMCIMNGLWEGGIEVEMEVLEGYEMKKLSHMYQENKENKLQLSDKDLEITKIKKTNNQYHLTLQLKTK
jgi:hypothetical protein